MSDREITLLVTDEVLGMLGLARRVLSLALSADNAAGQRVLALFEAIHRTARDGGSLTVRVARSPPAGPESG